MSCRSDAPRSAVPEGGTELSVFRPDSALHHCEIDE